MQRISCLALVLLVACALAPTASAGDPIYVRVDARKVSEFPIEQVTFDPESRKLLVAALYHDAALLSIGEDGPSLDGAYVRTGETGRTVERWLRGSYLRGAVVAVLDRRVVRWPEPGAPAETLYQSKGATFYWGAIEPGSGVIAAEGVILDSGFQVVSDMEILHAGTGFLGFVGSGDQLVSGGLQDPRILLRSARDGSVIQEWRESQPVSVMAAAPDGRSIAYSLPRSTQLHLRSLETGALQTVEFGAPSAIVQFSPDSRLLIAWRLEPGVRVYGIESEPELLAHWSEDSCLGVSIFAGPNWISGSNEGCLAVYGLPQKSVVQQLEIEGGVSALEVSPDQDWLFVGTHDGQLVTYRRRRQ